MHCAVCSLHTMIHPSRACTACMHAGQGLNMTFEDAAELAWHLQQGGLGAKALRAFEKERIPRVGIIVQKAEVPTLALPCLQNKSLPCRAAVLCCAEGMRAAL